MFLIIIYAICLAALAIGTYTDIKTREVPDWLNFSLIASGLGIRGIYSIANHDKSYIIDGLFGFFVFVAIAYIMFYAGQWGGGDSKMLMGLGAMLGLQLRADSLLIGFLVNVLILGSLYGMLWSFAIMINKWENYVKSFSKLLKTRFYKNARRLMLISILLLAILMIFVDDLILKYAFFALLVLIFGSFYLWMHIKCVEKIGMYKYVMPERLTEGDWIVKEVRVDGHYICGPKDLGIEKEQIKKLVALKRKGKVKRILIKEGIPFVPSFLLAFLVTILYGNLLFKIFGY